MSPEPTFLSSPEPLLFCHPERREGSLGTYVPRDDRVGDVAPRHLFFVAPSEARGLPEDAVPNEVRDAAVLFDKTG
jgi:hypothetical protein